MTPFVVQNWRYIDNGERNGTHNKIGLILGYMELLVAAPNGKFKKNDGYPKELMDFFILHLLES